MSFSHPEVPVRRFLTTLAAMLFVLAACAGGSTVVATVGGTEITLDQVEQAAGGEAVEEDAFVAELRNLIVEAVVFQAAAEQFGIEVSDEEVEDRVAEVRTRIEESGTSWEDFLAAEDLDEDKVRRIARQQLVVEALQEKLVEEAGELTEDDIQEAYDTRILDLTEACVRHLVTETEEEAVEARQRIDEGEAFAEVAKEVSVDPSVAENAGDLGCRSLGQYVPEFGVAAMEAPLGQLTGPVRSQFGYHLLIVDQRTTPSLDEVREELVAALEAERGPRLFQEWLLEVVTEADVQVDPEYGRWVTTPVPQVLPPE